MYGLFLSKRESTMLKNSALEFQEFFKTDSLLLDEHIKFLKDRKIGMDHIIPVLHTKQRLFLLDDHLNFLIEMYQNEKFWVTDESIHSQAQEKSDYEIRIKSLEDQLQLLFKTVLELKDKS